MNNAAFCITAVFLTAIISIPGNTRDIQKTKEMIDAIQKDESHKKNTPVIKKKPGNDQEEEEKKSLTILASDEALLKTGIDLYNSGLYSNAEKTFLILQKEHSQSRHLDSSHIWLGKIYFKENKITKAIESFKKVKKQSGEYPAALYYSGKAYLLIRQPVLALAQYRKVFSLFPTHDLADNAMLQAGKIYLKQKKGQQAFETFITMTRYYKDRDTIDDSFYFLAQIFIQDNRLRDLEKARALYRVFIKKAENGQAFFSSSPLLPRVRENLKKLERDHFLIR